MKKKLLATLGVAAVAGLALTSCNSSSGPSESKELKMNLAYGDAKKTLTYGMSSPITMPDGTVVSSGDLKPMWQYVEKQLNIDITDVTVQNQKATEMMTVNAANQFKDAVVFGGNSLADQLMAKGAEGLFDKIDEHLDEMPNLKRYLDTNPNIKSAITAYDGHIYHLPYVAEVGNYARLFHVRKTWVTKLLDNANATLDTVAVSDTAVQPFYTQSHPRALEIAGRPTKKTSENIIEIQNNLAVKNGKTYAEALRDYIKRNYDYTNPSSLYLGNDAAYDIDELVALFRCVKANPVCLTGKTDGETYAWFTRQGAYREEILRLGTYYDGAKVHGSDSYTSRFILNSQGQVEYTYSKQEVYNTLLQFQSWNKEGLIYGDSLSDGNSKSDIRAKLYGSDSVAEQKQFGFMCYDFTASTTADKLNSDVVAILPPVANVNGVWQQYVDNSRVIKPDGWSISNQASSGEKALAYKLFDYFFTNEGHQLTNYGLPDMIDASKTFTGPDGKVYPAYTNFIKEQSNIFNKGDYSNFLRQVIGCQMPIGYQKEIGFEYQYTSERGLAATKLYNDEHVGCPTYAGTGSTVAGSNPNYYRLAPPAFSLNRNQNAQVSQLGIATDTGFNEVMFNIIRGLDPNKVIAPQNYNEYLKYFKDAGLDAYQKVYQDAYAAMQKK